MPGTINISAFSFSSRFAEFAVLQFMDLPSPPSSPISIKVSMGKRECQAWDKGDFTFALTTLRDNLVLLLQDSEGNEISHAGVEVKSIVEKGLWDDLFPLKGGGFVRMKLQFVLNEEERNKIRMMRESAVKKKQGELINSSPNSVQSTLSAGVNVASSLYLREEISDRNEETLSAINLHQSVELPVNESYEGRFVEKAEAKPLPANVESTATSADKTSIVLRGSQSTAGATNRPNLLEDRLRNPEKQGPIKKTPSSVKKMISAFESGSAEDMRPQIKPPPIQDRSNKIKTGAPLESHNLEEHKNVISTETAESISKAVVNPFRSGDLNIRPTSGEKSGEQISLPGASDAIKSSHPTGIKNKIKQLEVHQVVDIKKGNFPKNFVKPSTFETVQVSDKILGKHRHEPSDIPRGKRHSGGIHGIEESRVQVSSRNCQITDVQGASDSANACTSEANLEDRHIRGDTGPNVCTSVAKCKDRHDPLERSGAWIFPDAAIHFCITTSGTNMMDSRGGCRENPSIHQKMNFSLPQNVEEVLNFSAELLYNVDRNEENQRRRSRVETSSEEAGTFGGAVGQAVKVAVVIGFGTLVLLTRQRTNRKTQKLFFGVEQSGSKREKNVEEKDLCAEREDPSEFHFSKFS
ncbi:uncharacterized protein LOC103951948 isoform X3 [Pyrus x bretschneideri]|uniref:uncharacterized protein LOC103951948 isoform X3 n=1 Tax=Pyrus x bretschneideri TaxID=225117 RepID=UPI002030090E|nr:uncharacterized protein LOC103951948 isoform X3 [Pyrus x bretschneideri]